jgi:putative endonuclease
MYSAYVLLSKKTLRYYIGSTDDIENRIREHNSGETKSIRIGIPWKVIYIDQFETRAEAVRKEKQIKARGAKRYIADLNKSNERVAPLAPRSEVQILSPRQCKSK